MEKIFVSTAALRRSSEALRADSGGTQSAIVAALTDIRTESACWGQDAPGNAFALSYLPDALTLIIAAVTADAQVEDLSERLDATANGYDRTEAENSGPGA
ncbi:hypothetical protein CGZ95_15895 [Enemella evansiae]|uniref:hypothetical protein n=1 Tax=Enemella evansiae TaxID=2016499 RepID=UPI000B95E1F3|nr:hypothetical protein [Enemella evansiae]OYN96555.1 hypothetical protein CGZ95_15895 [Enemella evansiae]